VTQSWYLSDCVDELLRSLSLNGVSMMKGNEVYIGGRYGEGGGKILRTALT
jgi:hypothetical protein